MTHIKNIFLVLLMTITSQSCLFGKILELDTLATFEHVVGPIDEHTFILFDVDETLITPKDAVLGPKGQLFVEQLIGELLEKGGAQKYDTLLGRVLATAAFDVVEKRTSVLIQELQAQDIVVFAFTAAESGQIGEISSFSDFRVKQLQDMGYDFTSAFPQLDVLKLNKNDPKKGEPLFKSGILFSSDHPKGEILKQFLTTLKLKPSKIIFVDDRIDFLASVEDAMKDMQIEFLGLHYLALEKFSKEVDEKLASFQFKHLIEQGEWLNDEKARKQLDSF